MPKALRPIPKAERKKPNRDQQEALEWVKERARPRTTKKAALPEAEGARLSEPARPARPADETLSGAGPGSRGSRRSPSRSRRS